MALRHGTVSRRPAALTVTGAEVTVTDLGSANGIAVNGAFLDSGGGRVLEPADVVTLSTSVAAGSRWQLQMYALGDESARFFYTA